jgi:fatty acid desaturase
MNKLSAIVGRHEPATATRSACPRATHLPVVSERAGSSNHTVAERRQGSTQRRHGLSAGSGEKRLARQPDKKRLVASHRTGWGNLGIWLTFLGVLFASEAALTYAIAHGPWWAAIPLVLIAAHLMHAHLLALHDAAHGTLCPYAPLNYAIGVFIGALGFIEFSLFRAVHHTHHAYLGTPRDEELWPFVNPEVSRWQRRVAAILELAAGLAFEPFLLLRAFFRRGSTIRKPALRRRIWMELVLLLIAWSVIIAATAYWHAWKYLLVVYLLPAFLAGNFHSWRKYVEHMGLFGAKVLECTRTVLPQTVLGRALSFTLFHEPYHGVHHIYARLPHAVLPELSAMLLPPAQGEIRPFPNYRSALRDMIMSLHDPRIGAQWLQTPVSDENSHLTASNPCPLELVSSVGCLRRSPAR